MNDKPQVEVGIVNVAGTQTVFTVDADVAEKIMDHWLHDSGRILIDAKEKRHAFHKSNVIEVWMAKVETKSTTAATDIKHGVRSSTTTWCGSMSKYLLLTTVYQDITCLKCLEALTNKGVIA